MSAYLKVRGKQVYHTLKGHVYENLYESPTRSERDRSPWSAKLEGQPGVSRGVFFVLGRQKPGSGPQNEFLLWGPSKGLSSLGGCKETSRCTLSEVDANAAGGGSIGYTRSISHWQSSSKSISWVVANAGSSSVVKMTCVIWMTGIRVYIYIYIYIYK